MLYTQKRIYGDKSQLRAAAGVRKQRAMQSVPDESQSVDMTKNMINVVLLLSSFVNFCATFASATWVRVDPVGFRTINYSLFFLLASFVFHLNQVYDYYTRKLKRPWMLASSDAWGAIRDCALALVLLPLGTWSPFFPPSVFAAACLCIVKA